MNKQRQTMLVFFLLVLIITASFPAFSKSLKGTVYHDLNRNLKFDKNEPGIPGVLVSNQKDVVVTDEKGRFKIKVYDECIFFITKPAGYQTPLDDNNLPQFYYTHRPNGSPILNYPGIDPTGKLPKRLNFPLFKTNECDSFQVIAFGDPQSRNETEVGYLRDDVVSEMLNTQAKFVIALGDIVYDDLSLYEKQNRIMAQIGVPIYNVPGNHDENYDAVSDRYASETFKRYFGPNYYSFDYGKVHFIVLDNVDYLGRNEEGRPKYQGKIDNDQLLWLKNDLENIPDDKLIVFNMHIPFYYEDGKNKATNVINRSELFYLIRNREHLLALAGHMHTVEHHFLGNDAGWSGEKSLRQIICSAACGAWWSGPKNYMGIPESIQQDGVPRGYHIFDFEGNSFKEMFKVAGSGGENQIRISFPLGKIHRDSLDTRDIVVNVFGGSERSVVKCKIDDLNWIKMNKTNIKDPIFEFNYILSEDNAPSWVRPEPSTHIWTIPFPVGLNDGIHKISVITTDQYGNKFKVSKIFEIK